MTTVNRVRHALLSPAFIETAKRTHYRRGEAGFLAYVGDDGTVSLGKRKPRYDAAWNECADSPENQDPLSDAYSDGWSLFAMGEFHRYVKGYQARHSERIDPTKGVIFITKWRTDPLSAEGRRDLRRILSSDGTTRDPSLLASIPPVYDYFELNLLRKQSSRVALVRCTTTSTSDPNYAHVSIVEQKVPPMNDFNLRVASLADSLISFIPKMKNELGIEPAIFYKKTHGILDLEAKTLMLDSDIEASIETCP